MLRMLPPHPDLLILLQSLGDHGCQSDGIHLGLKGIGAAGQNGGNFGASEDTAVLDTGYHVNDGLVNQIARMDIREKQHAIKVQIAEIEARGKSNSHRIDEMAEVINRLQERRD